MRGILRNVCGCFVKTWQLLSLTKLLMRAPLASFAHSHWRVRS